MIRILRSPGARTRVPEVVSRLRSTTDNWGRRYRERGKTSIFPIRFKPIIIVEDGVAHESTTNITTALSTGWELPYKRLYARPDGMVTHHSVCRSVYGAGYDIPTFHRSNNLVLYHAVCSGSGSKSLHHEMEMTLQVVVSTVFYPEFDQSDVRGNYSLRVDPCSLYSQ